MATTLGTPQQTWATRAGWIPGQNLRNAAGALVSGIQGLVGRNKPTPQATPATPEWRYGTDASGTAGWYTKDQNLISESERLYGKVPDQIRTGTLPGGREQIQVTGNPDFPGGQFIDRADLTGTSRVHTNAATGAIYGINEPLSLLEAGGNKYGYFQTVRNPDGTVSYKYVDPQLALKNTNAGSYFMPEDLRAAITGAAQNWRPGRIRDAKYTDPNYTPSSAAEVEAYANFVAGRGNPELAERIRNEVIQQRLPGELNEGFVQLNLDDPATQALIERMGAQDPSVRPYLEAMYGAEFPAIVGEGWSEADAEKASEDLPWWAQGGTGGLGISDLYSTLAMLGGAGSLNMGMDPSVIQAILAMSGRGGGSTSIFEQNMDQLTPNQQPMTSLPTW